MSDQRNDAHELAQSYRAIFDRGTAVILLIDSETAEIVDANPAAIAFYGYSREELTSLRLSQITPLSDHEVYSAMKKAHALEQTHLSFQHRRKDGSLRNVHASVAPVDQASRQLLYLIVHDATEESRAEEALRLRSASLEATANGVVITDVSGLIVWVNPSVEAMTGYSREELLGKSPRILKSGRQPDAFYQELWSTISSGRVWRGSIENRRKDGSIYTEDMTISPIRDADGAITNYVAIKQDATETLGLQAAVRASEARWKAMLEQGSDLVAILEKDGTSRYVSPSIRRMLGYAPEDVVGKSGFDLVHPQDVEEIRRIFTETTRRADDHEPVRTRFRHKDGSWSVLEAVSTNALEDPNVRGMIINARDVTARVRNEERRHLLESVVINVRDAILITDADLGPYGPLILYANPAFEEITGYDANEAIGSTPRMLQGPQTDRGELDRMDAALGVGNHVRAELVNYAKDGRTYTAEMDITPVRDKAGATTHFISVHRDITERLNGEARSRRFRAFRVALATFAEHALQRTVDVALLQQLLSHAVELVPGAEAGSVILFDKDRGATFAAVHGFSNQLLNVRFEPGDVAEEIERVRPWIRQQYEPPPSMAPQTRDLVFGKAGRAGEVKASLKVPVWIESRPRAQFNLDNLTSADAFGDEAMEMADVFGRQLGVMLQRLDLEAILVEQATTDSLTGLPNRRKLDELLQSALEVARAEGTQGAFCILDVDNFRTINDAYGHTFGDRLLKAIGGRLATASAEMGTLGRWTGDEFAILCQDVRDLEGLEANVRAIMSTLESRFKIGEATVDVRTTMGVAPFPAQAADAREVVHEAQMALRAAKQAEHTNLAVYEPGIGDAITRRRTLEAALRRAVEEARLNVHYQPRFDLRTRRIVAVEALARWTDPTMGAVSPGEFIPIAEDSDVIHKLGTLVLNQACAQAKAWLLAGTPVVVAVNLSLKQLRKEGLVDDVRAALERHGLPSQWLEIEITESAAMSNVEVTIETLSKLHEVGVGLAIDDFGTAYSSLSHLKLMPIDAIKIDQGFVKDLPEDPSQDPTGASIVEAIVALGKSMNLKVIAEGVETEAQQKFLKFLGCDEAQGFLLGRPVDAASLPSLST